MIKPDKVIGEVTDLGERQPIPVGGTNIKHVQQWPEHERQEPEQSRKYQQEESNLPSVNDPPVIYSVRIDLMVSGHCLIGCGHRVPQRDWDMRMYTFSYPNPISKGWNRNYLFASYRAVKASRICLAVVPGVKASWDNLPVPSSAWTLGG